MKKRKKKNMKRIVEQVECQEQKFCDCTNAHTHRDTILMLKTPEYLESGSQKDNLTGFQRPLTVQSVYSDESREPHYVKVKLMKNICFVALCGQLR